MNLYPTSVFEKASNFTDNQIFSMFESFIARLEAENRITFTTTASYALGKGTFEQEARK